MARRCGSASHAPGLAFRGQIAQQVMDLGIAPGDTVMLHAAVGSIGWIAGGPGEVLAGVLDVLGPEGTLMMAVGWEGSPHDFLANVPEVPPALLQLWPAYDPATSRATHEWSVLTECLRTWPGAQRSQHPDSSFAAVGRLADDLTRDHPLNYGMGEGSPLAKLCQHGGKVLLLGAPLSALTLLHHAEHLADVPDKQIVRYKAPILSNGQKEWIDIEEFATSQCLPWRGSIELFEAIARHYLQEGQGIVGRVGAAVSYLFDAAALNDFAVTWIEDTFQEPQEMLGDVKIRVADDRDHRELVSLFTAMEAEKTDTPASASRYSSRVDELLEDRNRRIFLAEAESKTLGMLVARAEPEQDGVLEYGFVSPEHRRQGILRELEIDASAFFIERGCTSIGLALDPDNHAAREAMAALGYAPSKEAWERPV